MRSVSIVWGVKSSWGMVRGPHFVHVSVGRLSLTLWRLDLEKLLADLLQKASGL